MDVSIVPACLSGAFMPVATLWRFSCLYVELCAKSALYYVWCAGTIGNWPYCAVNGHCLIVCVPNIVCAKCEMTFLFVRKS